MPKHKLLCLLWVGMLFSCTPRPANSFYTEYEPVLMTRDQLENSISLKPAQAMQNVGKIYTYQNFLFVGEKYRGFHVFDNTNPKSPLELGFVQVPGNIDIAVKDGFIYADNATDLVTLKWENDDIIVMQREKEVFPEMIAPDGGVMRPVHADSKPKNTIVVRWEK